MIFFDENDVHFDIEANFYTPTLPIGCLGHVLIHILRHLKYTFIIFFKYFCLNISSSNLKKIILRKDYETIFYRSFKLRVKSESKCWNGGSTCRSINNLSVQK